MGSASLLRPMHFVLLAPPRLPLEFLEPRRRATGEPRLVSSRRPWRPLARVSGLGPWRRFGDGTSGNPK